MIDERRVGVLSDTLLYDDANAFATELRDELPTKKQLMGLLTYSRRRGDLNRYIENRISRAISKPFYDALKQRLKKLEERVRTEWQPRYQFWAAGLTKIQERDVAEEWLTALVREFVRHVVAEALRYAPEK